MSVGSSPTVMGYVFRIHELQFILLKLPSNTCHIISSDCVNWHVGCFLHKSQYVSTSKMCVSIDMHLFEKKSMGGKIKFCPLMRPRRFLQFRMGICLVFWSKFLRVIREKLEKTLLDVNIDGIGIENATRILVEIWCVRWKSDHI